MLLALAAAVLVAASIFYWNLNGYPSDHGLAEVIAQEDGYSPETWACVVDIFEHHRPLPGTLFGRFVVEAVYNDLDYFTGFEVETAFASQEFQIGEGRIYTYHFNEFYDWAKLRDCSEPLFP